jgi:hypothetical protein
MIQSCCELAVTVRAGKAGSATKPPCKYPQ